MMPLNLFRLQLMDTLTGRSRLAVRFGVTLLLALPFILVKMPTAAKTSGVVMVILFTSFFGTAIAHARLCEDGRFSRLRMLPIPTSLLWLDLTLAYAVGRLVPAGILLAGFIIINAGHVPPTAWAYTVSLLCIAVLTLVALATLIGHLCRSNGQVHLVSALTCGVIASVSGIIPAAPRLSSLTAVLDVNPLYQLQHTLSDMIEAAATISSLKSIIYFIIMAVFIFVIILRWIAGSIPNK